MEVNCLMGASKRTLPLIKPKAAFLKSIVNEFHPFISSLTLPIEGGGPAPWVQGLHLRWCVGVG